MKVKVNYTINLDSVPDLIENIMSACQETLAECATRVKVAPVNFDKMYDNYHDITDKLDVVSDQIQDILNITAGWISANKTEDTDEVAESTDEKDV